jgi:hypothetical protein
LAVSLAWKPPVIEPCCESTSQPRVSTAAPLSSLYFSTPWTKPSMKIVTGGIGMPPTVPTLLTPDCADHAAAA